MDLRGADIVVIGIGDGMGFVAGYSSTVGEFSIAFFVKVQVVSV